MSDRFLTFMVAGVAFCLSTFAGQLSLDECKRQAADGDAEALWQLGCRYETGDGVRKDNLRAVAQYRKAAEKKHSKACARLGELYEQGKIVGKDAVQAAKYKAMANGDSAEVAIAVAKTTTDKVHVDEIEVALDYIIGRNGKKRDAKAGIRLLYQVAKDKPVAQRVFVERWTQGDLDEGLETISEQEWDLILPWFRDQFNAGKFRMGGWLLGNDAYAKEKFEDTVAYWSSAGKAGLAKAWFRLGNFYWVDRDKGGGPESMQSGEKAKFAYESCLKVDRNYLEAKWSLGEVCLYGKGKCCDYMRAFSIFKEFLRREPNDMWCLYNYGLAGALAEDTAFKAKWSQDEINKLSARRKESYGKGYRGNLKFERLLQEWETKEKKIEEYIQCIARAATLGCKPAQKFMEQWRNDGNE